MPNNAKPHAAMAKTASFDIATDVATDVAGDIAPLETVMSTNSKPAAIITSLTLDTLRDTLQAAGYRVETVTDPVANGEYLRSATAGVAFDVRPGNRLAGNGESFADVALVAVLQIAGEIDSKLPQDIVNRWNVSRRFGRLQFSAPFLVFCLDVSVINGVTPAHLRAQIELWDRLVQDLVPFLRTAFAEATQKSAAPAAGDQPAAA